MHTYTWLSTQHGGCTAVVTVASSYLHLQTLNVGLLPKRQNMHGTSIPYPELLLTRSPVTSVSPSLESLCRKAESRWERRWGTCPLTCDCLHTATVNLSLLALFVTERYLLLMASSFYRKHVLVEYTTNFSIGLFACHNSLPVPQSTITSKIYTCDCCHSIFCILVLLRQCFNETTSVSYADDRELGNWSKVMPMATMWQCFRVITCKAYASMHIMIEHLQGMPACTWTCLCKSGWLA